MSATKRPFMPRRLNAMFVKQLAPAFRRRGFAIAEILTRWPAIVGVDLARHACPERVQFDAGKADAATLKLRVAPGFALEMQHLAPLILERINTFYGYNAVARLKFTQGPVAASGRPARGVRRALSPDEALRLEALLSPINDPALKSALRRLGDGLMTADEKR